MIITKNTPYTKSEINKLSQEFEVYVKTVMDIDKLICCAGMNRHFEGEEILINQGSAQSNVWGGGIDLTTLEIDCNSFINIRPKDGNSKNDILLPTVREKYIELTKYFFKVIL